MKYLRDEMYDMLLEMAHLDRAGVDMVVHVLGDTPQTYIKILNAETEFKTFDQLLDYYEQFEG